MQHKYEPATSDTFHTAAVYEYDTCMTWHETCEILIESLWIVVPALQSDCFNFLGRQDLRTPSWNLQTQKNRLHSAKHGLRLWLPYSQKTRIFEAKNCIANFRWVDSMFPFKTQRLSITSMVVVKNTMSSIATNLWRWRSGVWEIFGNGPEVVVFLLSFVPRICLKKRYLGE